MTRCITYLYINLVTAQHNWDVFTNTLEITMPVRDVFVRDPCGHVEHDNTTLPLNVVAVAEATELFLSSCIPDIEADRPVVGGERERVHLNTKRC